MLTRLRIVLVVLAGATALAGCGESYTWGWHVVSPSLARGRGNIAFLLSGVGYIVAVAGLAIAISSVRGLLVALLGMSSSRVARTASRSYVELLHRVPMLVMVLWVYCCLDVILNIRID